MRKLIKLILLVVILCSCAFEPVQIPPAPNNSPLAVVFDIDGTLTPRPIEFLEARPDVARAVQLYSDKGYKIIYLSARFPGFEAGTRAWLKHKGFPDGIVRIAGKDGDVGHPDQFKTRVLQDFLDKGWRLGFAYGDSSTDFIAYAAVSIPRTHVFALRREGDTSCQSGTWEACLSGWGEHITFITDQAGQPTAER